MRRPTYLLLVLATACAGGRNDGDAPDLPKGWEAAERVDLVQFVSAGDAHDRDEQVTMRGVEHQILIEYTQAPFRPAQDVTLYTRGDHQSGHNLSKVAAAEASTVFGE